MANSFRWASEQSLLLARPEQINAITRSAARKPHRIRDEAKDERRTLGSGPVAEYGGVIGIVFRRDPLRRCRCAKARGGSGEFDSLLAR